jgi:hypothetical protein
LVGAKVKRTVQWVFLEHFEDAPIALIVTASLESCYGFAKAAEKELNKIKTTGVKLSVETSNPEKSNVKGY